VSLNTLYVILQDFFCDKLSVFEDTIKETFCLYRKVKQSLYNSEPALKFPRDWVSHISRRSADGKLYESATFISQEIFLVDCVWNVMAHAQKLDFVSRRIWRDHLNRPGDVSSVDYWQPRCAASAVVMLDTPCSELVWRVLATHCIRQSI